ncbi:MAG: hypothetical protein IJ830_00495 [Alphaproteobacteria bacterium]|nr:hypothetical protein [Alphaproteobacteria bacterium]
MKNNQSGRSMVEMLGVLAIIGVLSAGGLAGYSKAMFKHKLNSTMDQITMLVTNIRTMYGTQGNYSGLSGASAINLGIVPAVMGSTSAGLTNPFKGGVKIETVEIKTGASLTHNASAETGFSVKYSGLPKEACIALATADFGSGAGSGFIGSLIEGSSLSGQYGASSEGKAYDMSTAIGACAENKSVTWYFY